MKAMMNNSSTMQKGLVMMVLLFTLFSSIYANEPAKLTRRQVGVENLKMAYNSENLGLRKSAYELSGKMLYSELIPDLLKQAETEEDPHLQFVLALTLLDFNTPETVKTAEKMLISNSYAVTLSQNKTVHLYKIDK